MFGVPKCFLLCVQAEQSSGCPEEELCVPGIACSHAVCDSFFHGGSAVRCLSSNESHVCAHLCLAMVGFDDF